MNKDRYSVLIVGFSECMHASVGRLGGINFVFELEHDAKQSGEVNTGSERLLMLLISAAC